MAKASKKKPKPKRPKPKAVPQKLKNDTPVHLNMTFEEAIKKAVYTPIKNTKVKKK